jgi:hypothetical protein
MNSLEKCYNGLERLKNNKKLINFTLESFDVVRAVDKYRQYWRPPGKRVRIILLAESHVYTNEKDYEVDDI